MISEKEEQHKQIAKDKSTRLKESLNNKRKDFKTKVPSNTAVRTQLGDGDKSGLNVRVSDEKEKLKRKMYADKRRRAASKEVCVRDHVILKQDKIEVHKFCKQFL